MKPSVDTLAVFGGDPAFEQPLYVGRPNTGDREQFLRRVNDILDRKWLTNYGVYVQAFEQRLSEVTGAKHSIAVCNATVGLEVLARALGLHGEVIVPSFTFIASAHALRWLGITPVFADIDPATHNLDPRDVESKITARTTAILGVHTWGRACNHAELQQIAARHSLRLIYDAAHAFACSSAGHMIGTLGDAEVFSFHATKFVNTFEGGAISTNDDRLASRLRAAVNFGYDETDEISTVGTNAKMSEIAAAMGITGLESLGTVVERNYENYCAYREALGCIPGVHVQNYPQAEHCNYQYIVVEIDAHAAGIDRDTLMRVLHAENVIARRYFYPGCHMAEPYRSEQPYAGRSLPHTNALVERVLTLPNGTAIEPAQARQVAALIALAVTNGKSVCARLNVLDDRREAENLIDPLWSGLYAGGRIPLRVSR